MSLTCAASGMLRDLYRSGFALMIEFSVGAFCDAISTCMWPWLITYRCVLNNIQLLPLECMISDTTIPLNFFKSFGSRTTTRVVYGFPFAVPETKYSLVT